MSGNPNPTKLDQNQILQRAFDEAEDKLRIAGSFNIDHITGEVEVEIDAATGDNIALSNADGSKRVTLTTVGPNNGLDTNIIGGNIKVSNTLITESFDYITASYPSSTVEVYTYRTGGISGSIVGVITVTYSDATKDNLTSVSKV